MTRDLSEEKGRCKGEEKSIYYATFNIEIIPPVSFGVAPTSYSSN